MTYGELIRLYFDRSSALQWYWTVYVVVIGGLLAFSSLRQRPDVVTGVLVTFLYCFFAYKNLGAIRDVTGERHAVLEALKEHRPSGPDAALVARQRELIEPTLVAPPYEGIRNFHVACEVLTVAALWAMEWRRWRKHREERAAQTGPSPHAA